MKRKCLFVAVLAVLLGCTQASATGWLITQLTNNSYDDKYPQICNGQVVWTGFDSNDSEIFLYNGEETIVLTNNDYDDWGARISNGQVTWVEDGEGFARTGWEIFLYDVNQIIPLTDNDYAETHPRISNGQVVWYAFNYGNGEEVFFYDGTEVIQFGNNSDGISARDPEISNGQVVWNQRATHSLNDGIFLYDGSQTHKLGGCSFGSCSPEICDGQVVWESFDGNESEVFLYDGQETIQLTDDDCSHREPQISNGQIAWISLRYHACPISCDCTTDHKIYFYDGTEIIELAHADSDLHKFNSPQISKGQVVWSEYRRYGPCIDDGTYDHEILLYDGKEVIQLTNGECDKFGSPQISNGQVVWHGYDGNDYEVFMAVPCPLRANFDIDCDTDLLDFAILAQAWLTVPEDGGWNPVCNISDPNDDVIDERDLAAFSDNWLGAL